MGLHEPPRIQHRPFDMQVERVDPLKIALAACSSASFSRDGRWLWTKTSSRAFVWDTSTFSVKKEFGKVSSFAFSLDSLHLVVYQPAGKQIQVIELESGEVTDSISERSLPPGQVESVYFHPKEASLVIKMHPRYNPDALDRYDRMKKVEASYVTRPVVGRRQAVDRAQRENGEVKASQYMFRSSSGISKILKVATLKDVYRTRELVHAVHFSQDDEYALIIADKYSQVVKLPKGGEVYRLEASQHPNNHQGYSLPHTIWILDRDNNLLIDGVTGETAHRLDDLATPQFGQIAISLDRRYVAAIDLQQKTLRIRDLDTGQVITHSNGRLKASDELVFSPDTAVLLVRG